MLIIELQVKLNFNKGMKSSNDKFHFCNLKDIGYINILDGHPFYSVGVFLIPKGIHMPLHDHQNMIVFSKIISGRAEMKSYDKINKVTQE